MLRVDYDDDAISIIDNVNIWLEEYGLKFIDDQQEHDGYMLFTLVGI